MLSPLWPATTHIQEQKNKSRHLLTICNFKSLSRGQLSKPHQPSTISAIVLHMLPFVYSGERNSTQEASHLGLETATPPWGFFFSSERWDSAWCWAWDNREAVEWGGARGGYEPTCTWRSNILPLAHTGRWRSRHAARSASCRTPPEAIATAGSGDWWRRLLRESHWGSGTVSDPIPVSSATLQLEPGATTQTKENGVGN